ncbi:MULTISPECIES: VF530 family DNA-binding protein [Thiomicrorhabdus]|uniref:VF530 family protein n=1 Tax=Thiomicrorhabdus TaxID=2039723 RepID=UPI001E36DABF|nr:MULTISPECIES: VF530 family protein [Thiomicrorhabdus]
MQQSATQRNNPLHGITLKTIVTELHEYYGWQGLFEKTKMNCFKSNPSIKSSLTFLRKTPWARDKIEQLYLFTQREIIRHSKAERRSQTAKD